MNEVRKVLAAIVMTLVAGGVLNGQKASKEEAKEERVYFVSEVKVGPRITESPDPEYTEEARKNGVTGSVIIRCVFRASGEITDVFVARGLTHGLTRQVLEAIKKIKFVPAMKKGKPVSIWMELDYQFKLDENKKEVIRVVP
jgi:TonB family protein